MNEGKITKKDILAEIVGWSSLSRGDINNVIYSLIDTIPKYLTMDKSVILGDLGTLRLSFSSQGVETAEAFNVGRISGVRVLFISSLSLRKALKDITFEKA